MNKSNTQSINYNATKTYLLKAIYGRDNYLSAAYTLLQNAEDTLRRRYKENQFASMPLFEDIFGRVITVDNRKEGFICYIKGHSTPTVWSSQISRCRRSMTLESFLNLT